VAAVLRVEQHEQPTAVVAANLLTDTASVLRGDIDHDHIGRRDALGQLDRRPDHLQLVFLTEQQVQREVQQPPAPGHQDYPLWHVWLTPPHSSLLVDDIAGRAGVACSSESAK
jgi:hypothetical protein